MFRAVWRLSTPAASLLCAPCWRMRLDSEKMITRPTTARAAVSAQLGPSSPGAAPLPLPLPRDVALTPSSASMSASLPAKLTVRGVATDKRRGVAAASKRKLLPKAETAVDAPCQQQTDKEAEEEAAMQAHAMHAAASCTAAAPAASDAQPACMPPRKRARASQPHAAKPTTSAAVQTQATRKRAPAPAPAPRYFNYLLHNTINGTTYNGYTTDLDRRLREHNGALKGGARSTAALRGSWRFLATITSPHFTRSSAMSFEWHLRYPSNRRPRPKCFAGPEGRLAGLALVLAQEQFQGMSFTVKLDPEFRGKHDLARWVTPEAPAQPDTQALARAQQDTQALAQAQQDTQALAVSLLYVSSRRAALLRLGKASAAEAARLSDRQCRAALLQCSSEELAAACTELARADLERKRARRAARVSP